MQPARIFLLFSSLFHGKNTPDAGIVLQARNIVLYFFALPARTPLLFAGHAIVVAIHLRVWAMIQEVLRFLAGCHL